MFDDEFHVRDGDRILHVISMLVTKARSAGAQVIYVRNNGGLDEPDEPGTPGWEIHPSIIPGERDIVLDKSSPDAFAGTDLQQVLQGRGIRALVIAGMQTEMCVNTTCRKAASLGYQVTLVADGHTTFDWDEISAVDAIAKHNATLSALADVKPAVEIAF
jgi:nicotinamidase-related amidase